MRKSQAIGRGYEEDDEENREFDAGSDEPGTPHPLTSRVMYMLVDLKQWLELVRKRTRSSLRGLDPLPSSAGESNPDLDSFPSDQATERRLWDRLGEATLLDVESSYFSWSMLSSLHHTKHSGSPESDDDTSKAIELSRFHPPGSRHNLNDSVMSLQSGWESVFHRQGSFIIPVQSGCR